MEEEATHLRNPPSQPDRRPTPSPPPCRNPPSTGKDEPPLGAQGAPTDNSGALAPTSRAPTAALALVPGSVSSYTDGLFKQFMKTYPEAQLSSIQSPKNDPSRLSSPITISGSPQWSEDYFDTVRAIGGPNRTSLLRLVFSVGVAAADDLSFSVST